MPPDIFNYRVGMISSSYNPPQRFPDLIEIGFDALEPIQPRIGAGDDGRQWLFDLMGNRSRDRVTRHQSRFAFMTLRLDRAEQPRVKRRYLMHQNQEQKTAGD